MKKCKIAMNKWCNGKNKKLVQLRSQTAGAYGTNLYEGKQVLLCEECRKAHNGDFKIVKREQREAI